MSEYIEVGQPLQFTDPNTPTRAGEIVEIVSDIYNIPSPRLGMQVFVKNEKKSFVITSLKSKTIGGVDVPEAAVEAFEPVGAKSFTWNNDTDPSNMNDFVVAGVYDIKGEHTREDDNLPILNTGGGHTFNARLTVLDSSITGSGNSDDKCITQVLSFCNRLGQGEVYIRTGKGSSLDSLTWEKWSTLQRNVNVDTVDNLDDLKDNGIYSGVWTKGSYNAYPLTFVCIVINDYFVGTAPRRISQFVYGLSKFDGSTVYQSRVWDDSKNAWSDWEILNQKKISSMISAEIKKVTDGIDPEKIDSIKDIVAWIDAHGGDVTDIYNAIQGNTIKINAEVNRAQAVEAGLGEYISHVEGEVSTINANLAETKKSIASSLHASSVADSVNITGKSDVGRTTFSADIPAATTEKAGVMSAEDKKKLDKSEYTVEIGSINYLTGEEASSTTNVRTEHIPITSAGSIELLTSIHTPYKQVYIIQYLKGVYVGYTNNLEFEPGNYDSIRIRINYTEDVDEDYAKTIIVKILGNNTICGEVLENNYVSAEVNQFFTTQIQLPNPGFINLFNGIMYIDSTYATSDYIKVYPGQIIGITLAANGNAGVVGYSSQSNDGFLPIVQIPKNANLLERKLFVTIPENINYLRISSATSITPVAKMDYVRSINYDFLNKLVLQQNDLNDNPLLVEKVPFQLNHYFNLSTGKFSAADALRSSDYIKVYPGQQLDVTFAGYGNCGIAGFVKKEDIQVKEPVKGYKVLLKLPSPAQEGTYRIIIPENINYIKISSVVNVTPEGTIDYSSSVNYDFLNRILNNYDFNGLVEFVIHKLNCSAINNDYQGFRLNYSIPNDDDKLYLSTDIYNIATRSNPTTNELVKAFAPMLFYKMQKVGCFVLYDVENNNRPFIYDVDGNKKYITLTNN